MASVAHEGNPRVTPDLDVVGTLDGDIFLLPLPGDPGIPQEAPAEPGIPPVDNDECPGCQAFEFSEYDQDAIDQCTSVEGDGEATVQDDCPTVEDCIDFCSDYYGDFRIGLNCTQEGTTTQPYYWETDATWSCPRGRVTMNSSCAPAVTSREIRFDTAFFELLAEEPPTNPHFIGMVPGTALNELESAQSTNAGQDGKHVFQSAVCDTDIDCTTGESCAEEPLNNGMGLDFSCRYVSEENKGIIALALLNDDGTNLTITGYGILVDRDQGIAAVVSWNAAAHEDYTVLDSAAYTPTEDDPIRINMTLTCDDDDGAEDFESLTIIPNFGRIKGSCGFGGTYSFTSEQGVVTRTQFENITHCALIVLPNFNNQECRNTVTIRRVSALFQRETE